MSKKGSFEGFLQVCLRTVPLSTLYGFLVGCEKVALRVAFWVPARVWGFSGLRFRAQGLGLRLLFFRTRGFHAGFIKDFIPYRASEMITGKRFTVGEGTPACGIGCC